MFNNFAIWSFALNVLVLIVSISGFIKIMKNDLVHLEKNVTALTELLKEVNKKLDKNSERIAKIEDRCAANHGN